MKMPFSLAAAVLLPFLVGGCFFSGSEQGGPDDQPLTITSSIATAPAGQALATVSPPSEVVLTFSEPLNPESIAGRIGLQAVKKGNLLVDAMPTIEVVANVGDARQVIIRTANGARLASGEEYRLLVAKGISSQAGNTLADDYVRYFATDYDLTLATGEGAGAQRTITVVISDIHLGDQRSIDRKYGWFINNRTRLVSFLNNMRQRPSLKEIVIAGDMFDEWVAPVEYETLGGTTQSGFVDRIAAANKPIIDAINAIITDGNVSVIYVPGNHDMLVTEADVARIFPGIVQARGPQGLGDYSPSGPPKLAIEHGHRYDFYNAPDTLSNKDIAGNNAMLPPGFFVSKIAVTSDIEHGRIPSIYREDTTLSNTAGLDYYLTYWAAWQLIMKKKPVNDSWDKKMIVTGIDGYTATYAINDLIPTHESGKGPLDVVLYKGIVDNWAQRSKINLVPVPILPELAMLAGAFNPALDEMANLQYFMNSASDRRIVVFGHTHDAKLFSKVAFSGESIYANSGTWVDSGKPSGTFVSIFPQKQNGATVHTVTVYQYVDDATITKLYSGSIRD